MFRKNKDLYSIVDRKLILSDQARVVQQFSLLVFSILIFVGFLINEWKGELDLVSALSIFMIMLGVGVFVWSAFKKTFAKCIPAQNIKAINCSRYNNKTYMIELSNGRHRNLWTFRNKQDVFRLLMDLQEINPALHTNINFSQTLMNQSQNF
jgi:hypothetical protein